MAKQFFQRISCFALVICVLFSCSVPAYAASIGEVSGFLTAVKDFGEWFVPFFGEASNQFVSIFNHDVCPQRPEGGARHEFVQQKTQVNGQIGTFYICKYCGKYAGDAFDDVYDAYVSGLDSTIITNTMTGYPYAVEWVTSRNYDFYDVTFSSLEWQSSDSINGGFSFYFQPPESGSYTFYIPPFSCSCGASYGHRGSSSSSSYYNILYYSADNGLSWSSLKSHVASAFRSSSEFSVSANLYADYIYRLQIPASYASSNGYHFISLAYTPYLTGGSIIQDDPSTRPASLMQIINNYNGADNSVNYFIGPVDGDGNVVDIYSPAVYDEETLIFTEPVTGAQYQTTGWTYDYTTRTYQLSLSPGTFQISGTDIDRIDLTYGNDELTLSYYSDGSCVKKDSYAYVRAAESECALNGHTYTYETVKEATCTTPGERKYTCSVCGNQYAEDVPALGHDWNMTESTENTYALPPGTACPDCGGSDFQASLDKSAGTYTCTCSACGRKWKVEADITIGHSTYTCSRCGETRTETADSESGLFASIGNFIANGIGWVTDKLSDLINSISGINDIFSGFVESIQEKAGDYPAFLGAVIACLPEDLTTVIWFAVIAAIVLAVWKKWFH